MRDGGLLLGSDEGWRSVAKAGLKEDGLFARV